MWRRQNNLTELQWGCVSPRVHVSVLREHGRYTDRREGVALTNNNIRKLLEIWSDLEAGEVRCLESFWAEEYIIRSSVVCPNTTSVFVNKTVESRALISCPGHAAELI